MPVKPNFLERMLFYNLNLAPAPLLDLAGALSYQTVSTAARLNIFPALQEKSLTPAELANELNAIEYVVLAREELLQYIPLHLRATFEERFETVSGCLGVYLGRTIN